MTIFCTFLLINSGKDAKRASEALTPIREISSEDEDDLLEKKMSQLSMSQMQANRPDDDKTMKVVTWYFISNLKVPFSIFQANNRKIEHK